MTLLIFPGFQALLGTLAYSVVGKNETQEQVVRIFLLIIPQADTYVVIAVIPTFRLLVLLCRD